MVRVNQSFGSGWTRQKLDVVENYLVAYTRVMKNQPGFRTWYFDGFAGSGSVDTGRVPSAVPLIPGYETVMAGSARRALENPRIDFDEYVFVEKDPECFESLEALAGEFPNRKTRLVRSDCNAVVLQWAKTVDRRVDRAVVFLDPFALDVDWTTVEALGRTGVVDLWLWFPLWVVTRLLKRHGLPDPRHAVALERVYGGDAWRGLYDVQFQDPDLWGEIEEVAVRKDQAAVVDLYREQMLKCFYRVSESSDGWFYSSNGAPLYVLLFACANQGGSGVAMKIAEHLLSRDFLNPSAVQPPLGI